MHFDSFHVLFSLLMTFVASAEDERDIAACIDSLDIRESRVHGEEISPAYSGTFKWIFSGEVSFMTWLQDPDSPAFWIQGKPGSGKSTAMKYVMQDSRTEAALSRGFPGEWKVQGFFFYDRGSHLVQKSMLGLLSELLFGVLKQNRQLVFHVLQIYRDSVCSDNEPRGTSNLHKHNKLRWTLPQLTDALRELCAQTKNALNILMFIDGLDEHGEPGQKPSVCNNHLLDLLDVIAGSTGSIRWKLCLASRSEPAFVARLQHYPGFAMHEYTSKDIEHYISGRLKQECSNAISKLGEFAVSDLKFLLSEKAEGIFVWVRLAVNEVVQGIQEGESEKHLTQTLNELPPELNQMYQRVTRRAVQSRDGIPASRNRRLTYEVFVLFVLTLAAGESNLWDIRRLGNCREMVQHIAEALMDPPFTESSVGINADAVLHIASHGMPEKVVFDMLDLDDDQFNLDAQAPFVGSRSGGLIEANDENEQLSPLHLLHQTAKEYIESLMQDADFFAVVPQHIRHISGEHLALGYDLARLRSQLEANHLPVRFIWTNVLLYAYELDDEKHNLQPAFTMIEDKVAPEILTLGISCIIDHFRELPGPKIFPYYKGHFRMMHLAAASWLGLTLEGLIAHAINDMSFGAADIVALILVNLLSDSESHFYKIDPTVTLDFILEQSPVIRSPVEHMSFQQLFFLFECLQRQTIRVVLDKMLYDIWGARSYMIDARERTLWFRKARRILILAKCYSMSVEQRLSSQLTPPYMEELTATCLAEMSQKVELESEGETDHVLNFFRTALEQWTLTSNPPQSYDNVWDWLHDWHEH